MASKISASTAAVRDVDGTEHEDHHFDSTKTLIHTLRRAVAHRQDVAIVLDGVGELIVLPARGEWFPRFRDMPKFCAAPEQEYVVRCLNAGEVDTAVRGGVGRNIDEIMWTAGYYVSNGRLIAGCQPDDVVELKHWPNLTRLPAPPSAMAISALLTRYPTSIAFAARLLKVPMRELYEFYTAAYCAGIAVAINRTPVIPKLEPHKNRTMLGQLLARIAGM
jgi:hypothetical protein